MAFCYAKLNKVNLEVWHLHFHPSVSFLFGGRLLTMPPSSHSRRRRSIVDDDQSSNSYADEAPTKSGDVESVKRDNSDDSYQNLRKHFTARNLFLYLGLTFVIMMFLIGGFITLAMYLSQNIEYVDLTEACEDIFGKSDNHLAAEKHATEAYEELNATKAILDTKGPYDIPALLTFNHPDLVLSGDDVGVDQYLPTNIYPYHYSVKLRIHMPVNDNDKFKVSGQVRIEFNVTETSKRIYFNIRNINILKANDWKFRKLTVEKGAHSEVRYVEVPEVMKVGTKYFIDLNFTSHADSGMEGIYLSRYLDSSGRVHYTASTQFESMNARRLFPCLDEPYYRSSFTFVVEHPPSYDAYSNMPNMSRTLVEGGQFAQTTFAPLPNSPTYILALLITDDYAVRSTKTKDGTEIRMLARNEFIDDTKIALESAVDALEWFNKNFQIKYSLPKLDIAGIYSFEAGAMENYGLTTYRETCLFLNTKYSTSENEVSSRTVIIHEFLHQWFGNLVTPLDWSQTFMSEGFARFFEKYALSAITGGKEAYSMELAKNIVPIMLIDAKPVHPNDYVFDSALELRHNFDGITYNRAAAVFNMIRGIVGDDIFFAALRSYLSANKNGHAHWRKLAHALQKLSNPIMDRRWSLGTAWPIPIWYRVSSDPDKLKFVMTEPGKDLIITVAHEDDLIFVNSENHGFYIVNYEGQLFDKVRDALIRFDFLDDAVTRFQVDACPLFLTGAVSPLRYYESLNVFYKAKKLVAPPAKHCQETINDFVKDSDIGTLFREHLLELLRDKNEPEMHDRISSVATNFYLDMAEQFEIEQFVSELSCKNNPWTCTAEESHKFENHVLSCQPNDQTANCVRLKPAERALAYCQGIKTQNKKYYDHLVKLFISSRNPFEDTKLMEGLTCAQDSTIISKLFTLITTQNDHINKADRLRHFYSLYGSNPKLVRQLFIRNVNQILNDFPSSANGFLKTALISKTETDYLEVVQLLHDNHALRNRFAHVFRDILNDSRYFIEIKQKIAPKVIQYFKEVHEAKVIAAASNPELCETFGSCI
uniref:Aminopeptidase n=1 Tax=Panagrellus redivivus TaxID=6233 RepID=A0A7E4UXT7_PANRE